MSRAAGWRLLFSENEVGSTETHGQQFNERPGDDALVAGHVDDEVVTAEFPHDLSADAAGRERTGDHTIHTAAYCDGGEVSMAVVDGCKEGGAFGTVGGTVGGVFDVAALVDGAIGTEESSTDFTAGVGA